MIAARLDEVRERIASAARAAGRAPDAVTLVAVSKGQAPAAVAEALAAGQIAFGENYAKDLLAKAAVTAGGAGSDGPRPEWHFIGTLQRNKVAALAAHVSWWHTIDRDILAATVAARAPGARVLVQVNVAADPAKGGCRPGETAALVERARALGLDVQGLMTIPPAVGDPRPHFAALRELASGLGLHHLSMGMSADYEIAVGEGATIVRVGTAIFGARTTGPRLQR